MELSKIKTFTITETDAVFDSDFHPQKEGLLAIGTIEGNVLVVRTDSAGSELSKIATLKKHHKGSSVRKVCFSEDGLLLTAAKTVKLHDLEAGKTIRRMGATTDNMIYSMCVIDKYLTATGDDSGKFRIWDYRTDRGLAVELKEFEDFISDMDVTPDRRLVLASSGEGTIAAFNVRAKRMEQPQSELFEAGFNCIRFLESRSKVLAGSDDGVISIFNNNQWGNISDRFPIDSDDSIDKMEVLEGSFVAIGCSSGKTLTAQILPNKIVGSTIVHSSPVESLSVQRSTNTVVSLDSDHMVVAHFELAAVSDDSDAECAKENGDKGKDDFFSDL